jgi:hypothetical protein
MRAFSTMIAVVLVLSRPSLAGSAGRDLPGISGSPILAPAPQLTTSIGH